MKTDLTLAKIAMHGNLNQIPIGIINIIYLAGVVGGGGQHLKERVID